jgi:hypothetical protein
MSEAVLLSENSEVTRLFSMMDHMMDMSSQLFYLISNQHVLQIGLKLFINFALNELKTTIIIITTSKALSV